MRKGARGRGFITCHLLRLCLGREEGGTGIKQQAPVQLHLTRSARWSAPCPLPTHFTTAMPPGMDVRSSFFFLLLLPGLSGEGHTVGRGQPVLVVSLVWAWLWVLPKVAAPGTEIVDGGVTSSVRKESGLVWAG